MSIQGNFVGAALPNYMRAAPYANLLDNSDFRNPVNQRGFTSISNSNAGITYVMDRWEWWNVGGGTHNVTLTKGVGLVLALKVQPPDCYNESIMIFLILQKHTQLFANLVTVHC